MKTIKIDVMTVQELINELQKFPGNLDVYIGEKTTGFEWGDIERVELKENKEAEDSDSVIVLSEGEID